jgi:DNA polymerase-3 subunit beta
MDITISRNELARMLSGAAAVAAKKSPIRVLQCVILDAFEGWLRVSATDSYLGIEWSANATVKKSGKVAVDAAKLNDVVRSLPAGDVTLKLVGEQLEVRAAKAKLKLPTIDAADFPELPRADDAKLVCEVDSGDLVRAIKQGAYAMQFDDRRPFLGGALFEGDGKSLQVVTSDGARMAIAKLTDSADKSYVLVPAKGVSEARRLAESHKGARVTMRATVSTAFFSCNGTTLSVRLIEDRFPPWQKLVPTSSQQAVTVDRDTLSSVVKRIALVSDSNDGGVVTLQFSEGNLRVLGAGQGEGEEDIECDATKDVRISVNPTLFAQCVDVIPDDSVVLELRGELDAILIRGAASSDVRAIAMPRRSV